jgi:subtilisin family serine protease
LEETIRSLASAIIRKNGERPEVSPLRFKLEVDMKTKSNSRNNPQEFSMKKRLVFLLTLLLFATMAPSLAVEGGGPMTSPGPQGQSQGQAAAVKFRRSGKPVRDRYIVVLKDDTPGQEVESVSGELAARHGGGVDRIFKHSIKGFAAQMPEAAARALSEDPRVEYVEEDGLGSFSTSQWITPWGWNLGRIDQRDNPTNTLNDYYYNYSATGAGVHVYVLDTGLRSTHQEFGGRATRDFDVHGGNGDDCNGHGTHVTGIIGGSIHGVAREVRLHGVRVGERDEDGNIACGGGHLEEDIYMIPMPLRESIG